MSTCCRLLRRLPNIGVLLRETRSVACSADNVCAPYSVVTTKNHPMEDPVSNMPKQRDPRHNLLHSNGSDPVSTHANLNVFRHFQWIGNITPCFSIHGSQIHVLNDPNEFYEALKKLSRNSKKRIVLASLYLGTGKLEQELVDCVYDAAKVSQDEGGDLRVKFLFDYMRGSRGEKNSRTMLLPLLRDFGQKVSAALYHTPDLRGIMKRVLPERYNETVGVSHMKVYLFDDTLIMSGANLSELYFTERQDRYVVINRCPALADFFEEVVTAVSSLSFQLQPDDNINLSSDLQCHPFLGSNNGALYRNEMKRIVEEAIASHRNFNDYTNSRLLSHSDDLCDGSEAKGHRSDSAKGQEVDTLIYPLVQMGPFGIRHDEIVTKALFEKALPDVTIYLASGYFNLTNHYMNSIIKDCTANFEILTAAPQANGFFGASGVSGAIPDAYTYIAKQFFQEVSRTRQAHRISLHEYFRPRWTVHAKGLWYYLSGHSLPVATMIGSPNFGYRSVIRDLEAQVVIVTQNKNLQEELHQEQLQLYSHSQRVTAETFNKPSRHIPRWVTYVTPIIRNFF